LENKFLDIRVRQETIVSPTWEYIESWLKLDLIKITEENQTKAVIIGHELSTKENIKATSATKK
jgi:hypothetical protein